jgi:hypothetical protein
MAIKIKLLNDSSSTAEEHHAGFIGSDEVPRFV